MDVYRHGERRPRARCAAIIAAADADAGAIVAAPGAAVASGTLDLLAEVVDKTKAMTMTITMREQTNAAAASVENKEDGGSRRRHQIYHHESASSKVPVPASLSEKKKKKKLVVLDLGLLASINQDVHNNHLSHRRWTSKLDLPLVAVKGSQMESVAVVTVPFPAQGHLNQLLHLSLQLASRGLPVHYAAPAAQVRQARARVQGWDERALRSVEFHDLGISEYVSPPPDPTAPSPFPTHLMPLFEAYTAGARAPLAALLSGLSASHRRVVVVHDRVNVYAAEEAARLPNGLAFGLHCLAASTLAGQTDSGLRLLRERGLAFVNVKRCASREFVEYVVKRAMPTKEISPGTGILVNSCRALEGEFMDVVAGDLAAEGKKYFAVGPLNPLLHLHADAQRESRPRHECLDWLDKQPPASVLYVSFGSSSSLRTEQIAELAAALRDSGQRFIWVLRDADRGNNESLDDDESQRSRHAELLSKFTDQTEGRGRVITGWAPQLEILAHGATAAFMSHCGWNSTMESLSHGKPILAWPMHSDQPWDAELLCKYLNAGMLVRPWEKHGEVIPAEAIRQVIEDAMLSDQGVAMRQRAKVLGEAVRACVADGGSSRKGLDDFIAHVTK